MPYNLWLTSLVMTRPTSDLLTNRAVPSIRTCRYWIKIDLQYSTIFNLTFSISSCCKTIFNVFISCANLSDALTGKRSKLWCVYQYMVGQKLQTKLTAIFMSNLNRFSKLQHSIAFLYVSRARLELRSHCGAVRHRNIPQYTATWRTTEQPAEHLPYRTTAWSYSRSTRQYS